jgi:hypothetical protein
MLDQGHRFERGERLHLVLMVHLQVLTFKDIHPQLEGMQS